MKLGRNGFIYFYTTSRDFRNDTSLLPVLPQQSIGHNHTKNVPAVPEITNEIYENGIASYFYGNAGRTKHQTRGGGGESLSLALPPRNTL